MSMGGMMYQSDAQYIADNRERQIDDNKKIEKNAITDYIELNNQYGHIQDTIREEEILTSRLVEYENQIREIRCYMNNIKLELFDIQRLNYLKGLVKDA